MVVPVCTAACVLVTGVGCVCVGRIVRVVDVSVCWKRLSIEVIRAVLRCLDCVQVWFRRIDFGFDGVGIV